MTSVTLETEMQKTVTRNLLKFAAGTAMWCKYCDRILDARRAVLVSASESAGSSPLMERVMCATCFDKHAMRLAQLAQDRPDVTLKITDGRTLWDAPTATAKLKTAASRNPVHAAEVKIGDRYKISHTSGFVTVKVLREKSAWRFGSADWRARPAYRHWVCLNEKTGRKIVVKSAAEFRQKV